MTRPVGDNAGRHPMLVPEEQLPRLDGELLRRMTQLESHLRPELVTSPLGEVLGRALVFERWPELVTGEEPLDPLQRFYNQYFWFRRFAALWQAERGFDAGLEQQAHDLAAQAPGDVDWDLVTELDAEAGGST